MDMAVPVNTNNKTTILNNGFIRVLEKFDQLFISHQALTVRRNPWLALWGVHPIENSEGPWLCQTPGDTRTRRHRRRCCGLNIGCRFGFNRRADVGRFHFWHPLLNDALSCQSRIQSRADEDQDGRGQEDDRIVETQTEGARAAGKHESAQGIDDVGQRI